MKKFISIAFSAILAATLVTGCSSKGTKAPDPAAATAAAATPAADAVTSASVKESSNPADIAKGLSDKGYWIFAVLSDVTMTEDLTVDGTFHDKDDQAAKIYRKLALYAQDADHKVTAEYTLTVPKITVNSPNFRIQSGTVKGDIYVNAEGFELYNATVDGNLYFATQALQDAALLETGKVTGTVGIAAK